MTKFTALFTSSYKEMKNVRSITVMAMFAAISIVLGFYTIMLGETMRIGFTFLPNEFIYYLFGPAVGAFFGAALDILTFMVSPKGPYFFGFTLSGILNGLIYGVVLYKKPLSLKRIAFANVLGMIFINIILNTYWLALLYGDGFFAILPLRVLKELIMLPVNTILLYSVIKGVEASGILRLLHSKKAKV